MGIDDFGSGCSSLVRLRELPVDIIKVDRAFTLPLGTGDAHRHVVQAIVSPAYAVGMDVVAEGVVSERQLAALVAVGFDMARGTCSPRRSRRPTCWGGSSARPAPLPVGPDSLSHPLLILRGMWFTQRAENEFEHPIASEETVCRHTLVVHADGTHECEGEVGCGADALLHEWWLPCDELACGCAGEEHDLVVGLALAA